MTIKTIPAFQASYFSRDDQALLGFSKYFRKASDEEREHGMKLMDYQVNIVSLFLCPPRWADWLVDLINNIDNSIAVQVKRGGKVVFQDISKPTTMDWGSALEAMEAALDLEKTVTRLC